MAVESEVQAAGLETVKLLDPYIHIMTADSAEFSGHGVNTTVDVIDQ